MNNARKLLGCIIFALLCFVGCIIACHLHMSNDRKQQHVPEALYAYMLVCIYAIMQKCMHTLMKCTTSLGHGESSMQKGGAPVTRPVGVLDPAPPRRGCSCDRLRGNSCNSCKSAILAEDQSRGTSHRQDCFCLFRAFFRPKRAQKINMFFTSSWRRSWAGP